MAQGHRSRSDDTKRRLLDAAEQLFAEKGFRGTSVSVLAGKARVNQAAVNYHFGSKHALMEQVVERRLSAIGRERTAGLQAVRERAARTGTRPAVDALLHAFIAPAFQLIDREKHARYFLLLASRAFSDSDETIHHIFVKSFRPAFTLLFDLMRVALPDLPEAELHWRLQFVIGAMVQAMRVCGSQLPASDLYPPAESPERLVKRLISFLTDGLRAPAGGRPSAD